MINSKNYNVKYKLFWSWVCIFGTPSNLKFVRFMFSKPSLKNKVSFGFADAITLKPFGLDSWYNLMMAATIFFFFLRGGRRENSEGICNLM